MKKLLVLTCVLTIFNHDAFSMGKSPSDKEVQCQMLREDLKLDSSRNNPEYGAKFQKMKDLANTYRWVLGEIKEIIGQSDLDYIKEVYSYLIDGGHQSNPQIIKKYLKLFGYTKHGIKDLARDLTLQSMQAFYIQSWIKCPRDFKPVIESYQDRDSDFGRCKKEMVLDNFYALPTEGLVIKKKRDSMENYLVINQFANGNFFLNIIGTRALVNPTPSTEEVLKNYFEKEENKTEDLFVDSVLSLNGCFDL